MESKCDMTALQPLQYRLFDVERSHMTQCFSDHEQLVISQWLQTDKWFKKKQTKTKNKTPKQKHCSCKNKGKEIREGAQDNRY